MDETSGSTGKAKILFVDDEQRILTTMRMLFRRDYDVILANGGEEALEKLRHDNVDVIVSDQRMPGMTGYELLRTARNIQPNAMRILLTGYADLNAIIGSINEGEIFRFVSKPWSNEDLKATVAKAVEASRTEARATGSLIKESEELTTIAEEKPGILLLDHDPDNRSFMKDMLGGDFNIFEADTIATGLDLLENENIGVVISDLRIEGTPVVELLSILKKHQPHLVSIIVTNRADAHDAIDLINHGQVYRFLMKPVREAMAKINVRSAVRRHSALLESPDESTRFDVEEIKEPTAVNAGLMDRIRGMRSMFKSNTG